jgi:hypothetical protein
MHIGNKRIKCELIHPIPFLFEMMRWGTTYNPNTYTSGPIMHQLQVDREGLRRLF